LFLAAFDARKFGRRLLRDVRKLAARLIRDSPDGLRFSCKRPRIWRL